MGATLVGGRNGSIRTLNLSRFLQRNKVLETINKDNFHGKQSIFSEADTQTLPTQSYVFHFLAFAATVNQNRNTEGKKPQKSQWLNGLGGKRINGGPPPTYCLGATLFFDTHARCCKLKSLRTPAI